MTDKVIRSWEDLWANRGLIAFFMFWAGLIGFVVGYVQGVAR